jgi:hypothetical protein
MQLSLLHIDTQFLPLDALFAGLGPFQAKPDYCPVTTTASAAAPHKAGPAVWFAAVVWLLLPWCWAQIRSPAGAGSRQPYPLRSLTHPVGRQAITRCSIYPGRLIAGLLIAILCTDRRSGLPPRLSIKSPQRNARTLAGIAGDHADLALMCTVLQKAPAACW